MLVKLTPEDEGEDGNADNEEKTDAILCQEEWKTVRQIDLGQVHVDRVGSNKDDGEPEDDGPVRIGPRTLSRSWLTAVTRTANEESEDSEKTLKEVTNVLYEAFTWADP